MSSPSLRPSLRHLFSRSPSPLTLHVLRLNVPILHQLRLEEALLRLSSKNILILSRHKGPPTVVLGISGKPELWLNVKECRADQLSVIKRFTGGGTVYVDEETLFATFIVNKADVTHVKPFPHDIMRWVFHWWHSVFASQCTHTSSTTSVTPRGTPSLFNDGLAETSERSFRLNANDFCFGNRKVAGNAQSITKDRWLHHTSFLWRADVELMSRYLTQPPLSRLPEYRKHRLHTAFVSSLSTAWATQDMSAQEGLVHMDRDLLSCLQMHDWELVDMDESEVISLLMQKHDRVTEVLNLDNNELHRVVQAAPLVGFC